MDEKYEFIVNPQARSGRGRKLWEKIEAELKKRKTDYRVHMTAGKGHAGEIAGALSSSDEKCTIVVMGGDGTINEVLNGIVFSENVTLGYIPIGSSNDFARGMGIPKKLEKALDVVLFPQKVIQMDVGKLYTGGKTMFFGVSSGIGFDASVCHKVSVSRWKNMLNRLHLGKLTYAVVALERLLRDKPVRAEVILEDGRKYTFEKMFFAAFMNLPCEGGGFRFCPDALPDDGVLDVFLVSGISKLKILFLLPAVYLGARLNCRGITRLRCRYLELKTEKPMTVHTDGETYTGCREMEVQLHGRKLKVIAG